MDSPKHKFSLLIFSFVLIMTVILSVSACSELGPKADGSHFNFGAGNRSETSIILEKVVVDGHWYAPSTGTYGCSGGNHALGTGSVSVSKSTPAPQETIELQWYSWKEKARMKVKIELPDKKMINQLLLNPPWPKNKYGIDKSYFIIDFRPNHKVWIKLADTAHPDSQEQVMILAEGQGYKINEEVTRYRHFKEGKDYELDCVSYRKETERLGGYSASLEVYDRWYSGAPQNKELENE
ncbi:hypothetical protein [Kangiella shandongensis]|uniref:hypothetical protein n=1 Tax=Kangiella shandongensis TaxID=2763258 RepID=UPI001CC11102|nr:hypothetical protein [Kangiella shandongensis]